VHLVIYNLNGQLISVVAGGIYGKGMHSISWDGSKLPEGMYIYRLKLDDHSETGKIILKR
jgi:flagellar hook assembly protein FlgD